MTMLCITNSLPGRSCTIRGFHLTDVDGIAHYSRPGVECTGCLPRPAEVGLLCRFCWERFEAALSTVTDLIPHLRSIEKGPTDGTSGVRTKPGSRMIIPASWVEADSLWVSLAAVAIVHAAEKRIAEPDWLPWTYQPSAPPRGFPALFGFAAEATLNEVRLAVHELARWLRAAPEDVVARTGGAEVAVAMFRSVQRALHMFPMHEQSRRMRYIRCRACGQDTLRLIPPLEQLDDPTLICSNRECMAEQDPTLAGVDMLDLARTVAAERGVATADLERDVAELLRAPAADEAEPVCWVHARGLQPHLVVRKVKPVEESCVRCGIKTESGLYRRAELEQAA